MDSPESPPSHVLHFVLIANRELFLAEIEKTGKFSETLVGPDGTPLCITICLTPDPDAVNLREFLAANKPDSAEVLSAFRKFKGNPNV